MHIIILLSCSNLKNPLQLPLAAVPSSHQMGSFLHMRRWPEMFCPFAASWRLAGTEHPVLSLFSYALFPLSLLPAISETKQKLICLLGAHILQMGYLKAKTVVWEVLFLHGHAHVGFPSINLTFLSATQHSAGNTICNETLIDFLYFEEEVSTCPSTGLWNINSLKIFIV